jgi:2,4-dienoyl-CoA reductase-like NADH-dependent reductase (Old Yellow Enzyme family)/thioredoxin reductase
MTDLSHLFSPITIRNMTLKNRAVMAPMGTNLCNPDGTVSDASVAYLTRRAMGGPGLIITEIVGVHPSGLATNTQLSAYDDRFIMGLKRLTDAVHKADRRIAAQLHHAGRESLYMLAKGKAIGPSPSPSLIYGIPPREMTKSDIEEIVAAFGSAAGRAREAGFDAVEIHGAHGYLLMQFLSALSNQRTDEYGGSPENRARFILEILQRVRLQVGDDFPISLRLSVEECIKGGYKPEDLQPLLPAFVKAGADLIHASLGTHGSPGGVTCASAEYEPGFNVHRAVKIKEVVSVPVIAVGRITDANLANEIIKRGEADLVAFGRQFLSDPDFINKEKEGHGEDVCRCIACNQGCIERLMLGEGSIRCAINPETGQEILYPAGPAPGKKTVWVIGAGPAGMTAAIEAARLLHEVHLFEQEAELGGQIRYASRPPYKELYGDWILWLARQMNRAGIDIHPGTTVKEEMLIAERPDAVILATGGERIIPHIPGIDGKSVCNAWQILGGEIIPGSNIVIIGGGFIGMETADLMIARGSRVTLLEILKTSPVLPLTSHGYMLHKRLRDGKCRLLYDTTVMEIGDDWVSVQTSGEENRLSPVDQIVIATGVKSRDALRSILESLGIRHIVVGDALQPRRIIEATEEGARAAWSI